MNLSNNANTVTDDPLQLLTWLSQLDPKLRHQDVRDRRVEKCWEWLLQTEEFTRWRDLGGEDEGDETVLFCHGDPEVGKTFIR